MDIDGWGVVDIWATGLGKDTKGTLFSDRIGSFFILLGLGKGFYKEGIEICLFPISLSNEFSGNVSSRSLCFNFIVHILVCTFYDCQIGFNKNFSLQRKLCRLGTLKRSAKRVILRTKRNPFLEAKVLSPAWNLFFPQHSRRC